MQPRNCIEHHVEAVKVVTAAAGGCATVATPVAVGAARAAGGVAGAAVSASGVEGRGV